MIHYLPLPYVRAPRTVEHLVETAYISLIFRLLNGSNNVAAGPDMSEVGFGKP